MNEDPSRLMLIIFVFFLVIISLVISTMTYSTSGYTFVKYPRVSGNVTVCVEGEVNPTGQWVSFISDDERPTINPYVSVNGRRLAFNMTVPEESKRYEIENISLGCNRIEYGADTDTQFKLRIGYMSHWRPIVRSLEASNIQAGHSVRFFLDSEDPLGANITTSRLNLTDISMVDYPVEVVYREFNGSTVNYRIENPGNYKADMQVSNGHVWADVYEASFTVHVITTEIRTKAYRSRPLEDDPVIENQRGFPQAIREGDNSLLRGLKRISNGGYIAAIRIGDYIKANMPYGEELGLRRSRQSYTTHT
jgi:hypothetical protein